MNLLHRRRFLQSLALAGVSVAAGGLSGCGKKEASAGPSASAPAAADALTFGFIYNGPTSDLGYNQAHWLGSKALKPFPWAKVVEEASVPETAAAQESMRNMIHLDGAKVIFPTSFGHYDPHTLKVAAENPTVEFFHCGGLWEDGKHPINVGTFIGFIDEVEYLSGMVAGAATKNGKLGFIAAKPIPQVLRNINSFTLGVRRIRPDATVQVIFTGDWVMPVREAEAANSLANQGIDVLTAHLGSPRTVVQTAEERGIHSCGYQHDQSSIAPKGFLTGAEWNWGTVYAQYAQWIHEGKSVAKGTIPRRVTGTFKDDFCRLSPFGPSVTPETKAKVDDVKKTLIDGSFQVYRGEIRDNKGKVVIPSGTTVAITDVALDRMDWLVEGTIGNTA